MSERAEKAYDGFWAAIERSRATLEGLLGEAVLNGEIDASGALASLEDYERWLEAGQPSFTTLPPPYTFET